MKEQRSLPTLTRCSCAKRPLALNLTPYTFFLSDSQHSGHLVPVAGCPTGFLSSPQDANPVPADIPPELSHILEGQELLRLWNMVSVNLRDARGATHPLQSGQQPDRLGASRSSYVLSLLDKQRYPRWQIAGLKSIPTAVVPRGSSWSLQERRNPPSKGSCILSLCCRTSPIPLLQCRPVLWQCSAGIQKTSWTVQFLPSPFTSLSSLRTALKNGCLPLWMPALDALLQKSHLQAFFFFNLNPSILIAA